MVAPLSPDAHPEPPLSLLLFLHVCALTNSTFTRKNTVNYDRTFTNQQSTTLHDTPKLHITCTLSYCNGKTIRKL